MNNSGCADGSESKILTLKTAILLILLFANNIMISAADSDNRMDGIRDSDTIVFTANQGFYSRIYLMSADGTVLTHYEYENFHFVDLEVVNGEVDDAKK